MQVLPQLMPGIWQDLQAVQVQQLPLQQLAPDEQLAPGPPLSLQELQAVHWQLELQLRDWVPQLPQLWVAGVPGAQPSPVQLP